MSYDAYALLGDRGGWRVAELDISDCEGVDAVLDLVRDFDDPIRVLLIEQDDEYAVIARCDGEIDDGSVRVFLSNGHAADDYPIAALFADGLAEIGGDPLSQEDLLDGAPLPAHDAAPFGDPTVLEDLGMKAAELVELAVHGGTLPIELIESVCERLGCLDEFEAVRA